MFEDVVSRRQFITGVTAGGAVASMVNPVLASSANNPVVVSNYPLVELRPNEGPIKVFCVESLSSVEVEKLRSVGGRVELVMCTQAELKERASEAEVILGTVERETITRAKQLKWLQVWYAGVEELSKELLDHPCVLTNMQRVFAPVIAESAFALLLSLTRGLAQSAIPNFRDRRWAEPTCPLEDLYQKTMGVVGLGGIGSETARRACYGFNMRVLAVDPKPLPKPEYVAELAEPARLSEMIPQLDVLVSCAPHTRETEGMFNESIFRRMKRSAYFINVSRGALVDQPALAKALKESQIMGAGLDVTTPEPLPPADPLWTCPNLVITPHNSGSAPIRQVRRLALAAENLRRYSLGLPLLNVVDKARGY
jgi:phosphoglycerate dehydrogenase-like enzyme